QLQQGAAQGVGLQDQLVEAAAVDVAVGLPAVVGFFGPGHGTPPFLLGLGLGLGFRDGHGRRRARRAAAGGADAQVVVAGARTAAWPLRSSVTAPWSPAPGSRGSACARKAASCGDKAHTVTAPLARGTTASASGKRPSLSTARCSDHGPARRHTCASVLPTR